MATDSTTLAAQAVGVPVASFANKILRMEPDQGLEALVPEAMAKAWQVFPLFVDGRTLAVAFADPSDRILVKDVERAAGRPVEVFLADKAELKAAIARHYR
jgi:type IV pilus assembly protein PilB